MGRTKGKAISANPPAFKQNGSPTEGDRARTTPGTINSALETTTRLRDSNLVTIQILREFEASRPLTSVEQNALQSHHQTQKELQAQIKKLTTNQQAPKICQKQHQSSLPSKPATSARPKKGQAKRKKGGHGWAKKKSHKPPAHPDNYNFDPRRYYKIQGIMAETQWRYKIKWARVDSQGDDFIDTWVPKRYANEPAVADWEDRKAKEATGKFNQEPGEYDSEGPAPSSIWEGEE